MEQSVKIQQGNDFLLKLRPRMIDGTLVSPGLITNLVVNVGGAVLEHNIDSEFVTVQVTAGQPLGKYDVTITGKIGDRKIRDCRKELFERVPDGEGIPYAEYVTDFYIIGSTDAELEALKQYYRDAIAATETARLAYEAAKAELEEKAESLDDMAKETTSQTILTAVGNIQFDKSDLAKEAQATLNKQEIIAAMPSTTGLATTQNVTSAQAAIIAAILNVPTVQQIQNGLAKTSELPTDYAKQNTLTDAAGKIDSVAAFFNLNGSMPQIETYGVEETNNTVIDTLREIVAVMFNLNEEDLPASVTIDGTTYSGTQL